MEEEKELLWGYGSGVAAATTADSGDVGLAEHTQPFNAGDVAALSRHLHPAHLLRAHQ